MQKTEDIIGIHYGHDATIVLLRDGKVLEAMSEERLSRQKKHIGFPVKAFAYLKKKYALEKIEHVYVVGEEHSPIISWNAKRNEEERASRAIKPDWFLRGCISRFIPRDVFEFIRAIRQKFYTSSDGAKNIVEDKLKAEFPEAHITYVNHHLAHVWAAVPFFPSYEEKRAVVTLDGEGDGLSGMVALYDKGRVEIKHRFKNSESLGLLYASVVDVLGMSRNEHEFKVMGLAPYAKQSSGEAAYAALTRMLRFDEERMEFTAATDMRNATEYLVAHNINTAHRFDSLAYGIQKLTETQTEKLIKSVIRRYGTGDIAVGGGVFMNVKANQRLLNLPEVSSFVITPSCGDESLAIGAAVYGYAALHEGNLSQLAKLASLYLGSSYEEGEIKDALDAYPYVKECGVTHFNPVGEKTIEERVAELLAENNVVGRFKGRAEWGARALGNRSILANPSSRENVKLINEMIKGRDFWMPFAASILKEEVREYLQNPRGVMAPYMAVTFETTEKAHTHLEAALHPYDLTSRPQMVEKDTNPEYHALISHFKTRTGIGGILNTSFNLHGEPNVETPHDALRTFERSGLRYLAIGNYLVEKKR